MRNNNIDIGATGFFCAYCAVALSASLAINIPFDLYNKGVSETFGDRINQYVLLATGAFWVLAAHLILKKLDNEQLIHRNINYEIPEDAIPQRHMTIHPIVLQQVMSIMTQNINTPSTRAA
jgi:hypothetical protein